MFWSTQLVLLVGYLWGVVAGVESRWLITLPLAMGALVLYRLAGVVRRR